MPAVALTGRTGRDRGLVEAYVHYDDMDGWGWICWKCSDGKPFLIQQSGFETRDGARRAGKQHEQRRGH
jgi:hypothetical protein